MPCCSSCGVPCCGQVAGASFPAPFCGPCCGVCVGPCGRPFGVYSPTGEQQQPWTQGMQHLAMGGSHPPGHLAKVPMLKSR
ncbi:hypothetical protein KGM_200330 [Danaus plexippus plexippus]|uniref:Uncharacterized protein n=1 Tax=Danaus plexippus plexippus TaxID=278856 RepID=A0A212EIT9_DANPL|nr:hypothetical protein KGM_200330 [Danaus plexippus plexippus]